MNSAAQSSTDAATNANNDTLYSKWMTIDQERIDIFAKVTNDPDKMHIDPDYARDNSPFGTTIAFGFLTMSLLTYFHHQCFQDLPQGMGVNYGFNHLRLAAPVPVDSEVRGVFSLKRKEPRGPGQTLLAYDVMVEIKGSKKPALIGEWLTVILNTSDVS